MIELTDNQLATLIMSSPALLLCLIMMIGHAILPR